MLPMKHFKRITLKNYLNKASLFALAAALGTAGYSMTDDFALHIIREEKFSPLIATFLFLLLEIVTTLFFLGLFVFCKRNERKKFALILQKEKFKAFIAGTATYLAYGLVLVSTAYVTNVSYVAALRQLSIPIGAVLGILFLKEARYVPRIAGITAIFSGLILVGLG
jgi:drug/metabolite transporter (DMT)-like permease